MIGPQWTHRRILSDLAATARSYLEVGVQDGGSLAAVIKSAPRMERLVLCDDWGTRSGGTGRGSHDHIERLLGELGYDGDVVWLDGRSQEMLPKWLSNGSRGVDLVHVDGEHSEESCLSDMEHGWSVCRSHMVVHDVSFLGVHAAVFKFGAKHADEIASATLSFDGYATMVLSKGAA